MSTFLLLYSFYIYIYLLMAPYVGLQAPEERVSTDLPQDAAPAVSSGRLYSFFTSFFLMCLLMTPYVGLQAPEERVATDPPQDAAPVVSSGCLNAGISPCTLGKLHFFNMSTFLLLYSFYIYIYLLMAPYVGLQAPEERVSTDLPQDAAPAVSSGCLNAGISPCTLRKLQF